MLHRCITCGGRIWPWQHFGFRVWAHGVVYWHIAHAPAQEEPSAERP